MKYKKVTVSNEVVGWMVCSVLQVLVKYNANIDARREAGCSGRENFSLHQFWAAMMMGGERMLWCWNDWARFLTLSLQFETLSLLVCLDAGWKQLVDVGSGGRPLWGQWKLRRWIQFGHPKWWNKYSDSFQTFGKGVHPFWQIFSKWVGSKHNMNSGLCTVVVRVPPNGKESAVT